MTIPVTTNYTGRQIDVELLQSVSLPRELISVTVSNVTDTPKIVTGIEKMVQRYATLLLSIAGTVHFDSTQGCDLLRQIITGQIRNIGLLQGAFAVANSVILRQIKADDTNTDLYGSIPADERISSAALINADVNYGAGIISMRIRITTEAGNDYVFVVPLPASLN